MKRQSELFPASGLPHDGTIADGKEGRKGGKARTVKPNRDQLELVTFDWDSLLPEDHRARVVWAFVEGVDISELYAQIGSVEGRSGRPATDPRVFVALWLFATLEGVGSARALERACQRDVAYRWILGGVRVNHHSLADFRTAHEQTLDRLVTQSAAALMVEGLVEMERVAQDGMRVRASAGAGSFRRERTLEQCLDEAQAQVEALKKELHGDPGAEHRRREAARRRAAQERRDRVAAALEQMAAVKAKKKAGEREKARVSTTDPEARVMKMADGGFRPAYNVQFATDTPSQVILGVEVSNHGSDQGQMTPMVTDLERRYQRAPTEYLVDGGFAGHEEIERVTKAGIRVFAPVMRPKDDGRDPFTPLATDSPEVATWRRRMSTPQAKEIYKARAATAECVHAQARNRGLRQFLVRGVAKVRAVALWYALAHNLLRAFELRAAGAAA